jgi:uncharacterized protein YcbX
MAKIHAIYRYPIKGLSPEPLKRASLAPGQTIPGDRLYAIENGPSGFDAAAPAYLAKTHFLMLMKNERLARLRTNFDQQNHTLTITSPSPQRGEGVRTGELVSADLRTAEGRAAIETFFANFCADELRGSPKLLHADGHSFSDVARKVLSIINLASVAAIEDMVDAPVHPLRFRGNLYVEGLPAWSELDLVGRELKIVPHKPSPPPQAGEGSLFFPPPQAGEGSSFFPPPLAGEGQGGGKSTSPAGEPAAPVRIKVVKRIVRCAATNVDPDTAMRDLEIPQALLRHLGHADCGIYAEVIQGGEIEQADRIEIV